MLNHLTFAAAIGAAALVPVTASAQSERSSPVARFHLVQISVNSAEFPREDFAEKTEAIRSCNDATKLGKSIGAKVTRNRFVRASQLPDQLKIIVEELPTGHATPVYTDEDNTMRVMVLCNRA